MPVIMDPSMRKMLEQKASLAGISEAHYREFFARVGEQVASNKFNFGPACEQWLVGRMVWDRFFDTEPFPFKKPEGLHMSPHSISPPETTSYLPPVSSSHVETRRLSSLGGNSQSQPKPSAQHTQTPNPNYQPKAKEDQYESHEKLMETKATALGKRRDFFITLQRGRDEANWLFSDCSRHYRQWYAQSKVWNIFFKNEPFPGKKPTPYELSWDRARKDTAIASSTKPPRSSSITDNRQPVRLASIVPTVPTTSSMPKTPQASHANNSREPAKNPSAVPTGPAASRKPLSPIPTEKVSLPHGDFYTPRDSVLQGDFYRPEAPKDKRSPQAKDSKALMRARKIKDFPYAMGWGDRHIPTSRDHEYGRLSYDDEPPLSPSVSAVEQRSIADAPRLNTKRTPDGDKKDDGMVPRASSSDGLKEQPKIIDHGLSEAKVIITDDDQTTDVANIVVNGKTFFCAAAIVEKIINVYVNDLNCSWVASCLNCQFIRQRTLEGNVTFYAIPLIKGDEMSNELADKFLENWIHQALQTRPVENIMSVLAYWKFVQGDNLMDEATIPTPAASREPPNPDKNHGTEPVQQENLSALPQSTGLSASPSYIDELDLLLAEESAKVEGNSRTVLDEDTGEVVTLGEFKIRVQSRVREHVSQYKDIEIAGQKRGAPEDDGKRNGDSGNDVDEGAISATSTDDVKRICIRPCD